MVREPDGHGAFPVSVRSGWRTVDERDELRRTPRAAGPGTRAAIDRNQAVRSRVRTAARPRCRGNARVRRARRGHERTHGGAAHRATTEGARRVDAEHAPLVARGSPSRASALLRARARQDRPHAEPARIQGCPRACKAGARSGDQGAEGCRP